MLDLLKTWVLMFTLCCVINVSVTTNNHIHSHDHHHHSDELKEDPSFKYSKKANEEFIIKKTHDKITHSDTMASDVWLYAVGSTLFISAAPVLVLMIVPLDNTEKTQPLLKVLLAFASGGLLGDAFLHLIPHAALAVSAEDEHHHHGHSHNEEGENHSHDMSVGLGVLSGIVVFLVIEKAVRILKGNGHGHSHKIVPVDTDSKNTKETKKSNTAKDNEIIKSLPVTKEIKVSGYLNLAADFSHNFTDGLAIGASYLAGNSIGIVTTITILLHEIPHEIGDFAILLQSGISRKNAMLLQLSTAIGALAGTIISLLSKDGGGILGVNWVLPFTAGGFIYIALVSVIPELLDEEKPTLIQTILQVSAMLGGVYMMVLIAQFE